MKYLNESGSYISLLCNKCDRITKKHKTYCKQYGDEYHFNPPITCLCGNTESVAYKKVMDNSSNSLVDDNKLVEARHQLTRTIGQINVNLANGFAAERANQLHDNNINREFGTSQTENKIRIAKHMYNMLPFHYKVTLDVVEAIENTKEGILDGIKEGIRKSPVYKMGKYEGEIEGYTKASKEYEDKLLKQALKFKEVIIKSKEEYEELEKLLDEYEKYIGKLEAEIEQLSAEQQKRLEELISNYERLLKLRH